MSVREERQIVEAARNGDVESFGKLYERYYPTMVWLAYSILADRHLAQDAAQEAFAVACEGLADLKQADRFGRLLAGICRNVARQMARQNKREVLTNDPPAAVEQTDDNGLTESVRLAIGGLPQIYREALMLRYWNAMSYEEMARVLGIGTSRVKGRLFRARGMVQKGLKRTVFELR
ncbi:MAG TPA: sigma-70 family RNA polymerase sigma factor [Sedimentisphaerales bacterium]|nr:sigma-70 family RNA polymerase sigma factor [Sedimentisphaerales bacterium]